jgi:hypothetical protein
MAKPVTPDRPAGFYKIRTIYTASTYQGADFEVAYWDGKTWLFAGSAITSSEEAKLEVFGLVTKDNR